MSPSDPFMKVDFSFDSYGATDIGLRRKFNEDRFAMKPNEGVWVVADGMGGHAGGDFASQAVVDDLPEFEGALTLGDLETRFHDGLAEAHVRMLRVAKALNMSAIATTVVGLLVYQDEFAAIWSGDSRLYQMRNGTLNPVTRDHSEARELVDAGVLTPDQARSWHRRNIVTRALGVYDHLSAETAYGEVKDGDAFLLCTDGLTEHNTDKELETILAETNTAQEAVDRMINQTLDRGAVDNVTAIVVRVSK
ncbi:MAG: PP2C family serine/threonine-protein phosphatase [Pseudomonadota bacterium]